MEMTIDQKKQVVKMYDQWYSDLLNLVDLNKKIDMIEGFVNAGINLTPEQQIFADNIIEHKATSRQLFALNEEQEKLLEAALQVNRVCDYGTQKVIELKQEIAIEESKQRIAEITGAPIEQEANKAVKIILSIIGIGLLFSAIFLA